MKILIAVPCMDMVSSRFAKSLATVQKPCDTAIAFQIGSLIYESRNKLAAQAIKYEADYVMWFDSDMEFAPDTLVKLFEHCQNGLDLVSGIYFRRVAPFKPVLYSKLSRTDGHEGFDNYPKNALFEIAGCGFGCVLMKSDVLLEIAGKEHDWFSPVEGYGEDLSFCIRAREAGYKIYCDSRIKCGHVGYMTVDETAYDSFRNVGEQK